MKSSDNTLLLAGLFVLIVVIIALIVYYTRQGETKTVEQTSDTTKLTVENLTFERTLNPDPSVGDGVSGYTIEPYGVEYTTGTADYTELSKNVTFTMKWTNAPGFNNVVKGFKIKHYVGTTEKHEFQYNSEITDVDGESISFSNFGGCTVKLTSANWATQGNVIGQNKFKLFAVRTDETADNILYDGTVATGTPATFPPELKISESQLSVTLSMTTPETATFKPEKPSGTSTRAVISKTVYDISNNHMTLTKNDIGIYLETVENSNNKNFYFQYEDGEYLLEDLSKGVPTTANPKLKVEIVNKETGTLIGEIKKVDEDKYLSSPEKLSANEDPELGLYTTNDSRLNKKTFEGFKWTFNERISKSLLPHGTDFNVRDSSAEFGYAVCVFGDDAFVGQPKGNYESDIVNANDKGGRVHIYRRNTAGVWEFKKTITSAIMGSDPTQGGEFGCSVSISKDYAVIGEKYSPGRPGFNDPNAGKVYILKRDVDGNWETRSESQLGSTSISDELKRRHPVSITGVNANELFGSSVAISDKFLVVGAPGGDGYDGKGVVKLYKLINKTGAIEWARRDTKEGKTVGERFGYAVDISGDRVIVGAPHKGGVYPDKSCDPSSFGNERAHCPDTSTTNAEKTGSVSIYKIGRAVNGAEILNLEREMNPPTWTTQPEGNTFFGESVAIDGMIAVIGMPGDRGYSTLQTDNANVGAVYVLKGDGDRTTKNVYNPAPLVRWDMSTYGEVIFDGSNDVVIGGGEEGEDIRKPVIPNVRKNGEFGKSVSISGDTICIGQPGGGSGDVYVYKYKLINTDKYHYGDAKNSNNQNNAKNESRIKLDLVKTIKSPMDASTAMDYPVKTSSSGKFGNSVSNSGGYVMIGDPRSTQSLGSNSNLPMGSSYITAI
jgi:hypothetical protein